MIKGILHDSEDPQIIEGTFEWAVTSEDEKEKALTNLYENEEVTEILEITLEECIAHEEKIMRMDLYGTGRGSEAGRLE